jgi:beta-phosphoglucomutase-like phosphatase (HAD superfamily)
MFPQAGGKPAPDIFLLAAQRLNARPDRCLVYEDADAGITAALAAGMTAYNVRTGQLLHPNVPHRPSDLHFEPIAPPASAEPGWGASQPK